MKYVLHNKLLWYIAIANAFVYLIRYGVLDWAPTYLKEARTSAWITPPGPISSMSGRGSWHPAVRLDLRQDVQGRRAPAGILFMVLVTLSVLVYWFNPAGNPTIDMMALVAIGFPSMAPSC